MSDFKLKLLLTILSSMLFSLILIMLALVLPINNSNDNTAERAKPQTEFQKMSKGMREGFNK
ncbi:MAG: hypothetical protein IBX43_00950 [Campylobacterales bacterium]|nr:hypothetical protein [Campylobacterales bacterium]